MDGKPYGSLALSLALSACGASTSSEPEGLGGGAGGGTAPDGLEIYDAGPGADGCSEAAKLVYLLSLDNDLYSFAPASLTLSKIGPLDCPTSSTPFDLAIARDATAYVFMDDGSVYRVDTTTASCLEQVAEYDDSGYAFGGVAFVADGDGSTEVLYTSTREFAKPGGGDCSCGTAIQDDGSVTCFPIGKGLAHAGTPPFSLTPIGDYTSNLDQQILALTGTGDGRLFGYFSGYPYQCGAGVTPSPEGPCIVEIDQPTGATPEPLWVEEVQVGQTATWAFSHWGGDFWLYSSAGGNNSQITRFRYSGDQSFSVVVPDTGMQVVGAGVSTCAPVGPLT